MEHQVVKGLTHNVVPPDRPINVSFVIIVRDLALNVLDTRHRQKSVKKYDRWLKSYVSRANTAYKVDI